MKIHFLMLLSLNFFLLITLFPFCELSYACTKCFSSGPLVFPGPIFMNHREQALARIRPHPAQLKHKRDKHKGIWSSLWTYAHPSSNIFLHWIFVFREMLKSNSVLLAVLTWGEREHFLNAEKYKCLTISTSSFVFAFFIFDKVCHCFSMCFSHFSK